MAQIVSQKYTKDYIDYVFFTWYSNGRISASNLLALIEADARKQKPGIDTVRSWIKKYDWESRADELDVEVHKRVQEQYISEKAKMLARHASVGRDLIDIGIDFLEQNGITSQNAALRSIELGIGVEENASQLEKLLKATAKMDDPTLTTKLSSLLEKTKFKNDRGNIEES